MQILVAPEPEPEPVPPPGSPVRLFTALRGSVPLAVVKVNRRPPPDRSRCVLFDLVSVTILTRIIFEIGGGGGRRGR